MWRVGPSRRLMLQTRCSVVGCVQLQWLQTTASCDLQLLRACAGALQGVLTQTCRLIPRLHLQHCAQVRQRPLRRMPQRAGFVRVMMLVMVLVMVMVPVRVLVLVLVLVRVPVLDLPQACELWCDLARAVAEASN